MIWKLHMFHPGSQWFTIITPHFASADPPSCSCKALTFFRSHRNWQCRPVNGCECGGYQWLSVAISGYHAYIILPWIFWCHASAKHVFQTATQNCLARCGATLWKQASTNIIDKSARPIFLIPTKNCPLVLPLYWVQLNVTTTFAWRIFALIILEIWTVCQSSGWLEQCFGIHKRNPERFWAKFTAKMLFLSRY